MRRKAYPKATKRLIMADSRASHDQPVEAAEGGIPVSGFARLAYLGLPIQMAHFPPATSKWSKIEPRPLFFLTANGRATPLVSYQTIFNLIATTRTKTGLRIKPKLT
jgi:hypothetical protein